jgi:endonuclease/exonuclease/phosphatase family metal-dependent hydrolase
MKQKASLFTGAFCVLAVILLLKLPWRSEPVPPPLGPSEVIPLKVITFNVQFLPGIGAFFNKRPDAEYRARTLAHLLAKDYDIIGLNEVFDSSCQDLLLDGLRERLGENFHCVTSPKCERSSFGIGSGLVLVTRLPVLASHSLRYGNDSSVWKYGLWADGFAAKGALHARLSRGRDAAAHDTLDVFVTHLESQDPVVREAQYAKLAEFIRAFSAPNRPALILGDFNTDGRPNCLKDPASQYQRMYETLKHARPSASFIDLWPSLSSEPGGTNDPDIPDGGERIDYIFLSNPADARPRLRPTAVRVNQFLDAKMKSLSDHCAVEVDLLWER